MVLSEKERKELHDGISEYLSAHGLHGAADAVKQGFERSAATFTHQDTVLEKRWNMLRRLNLKNMELDNQVKVLQNELRLLKDPTKRKEKNSGLLPSEPAFVQMKGHRETLTAVALHPHEPLCFSASEDGSIRVWDTDLHTHIKTLRGHTDNVSALSVEPVEGKVFASCSNDQTVKVYDSSTFECVQTLFGHDAGVSTICWVGDAEKTLVSGGRDGEVRVWDQSRGSLKHSWRMSEGRRIRSLCMQFPSSNIVGIAGDDEAITLYDIKAENLSKAIPEAHSNSIQTIAFSHFEADCAIVEAVGNTAQKSLMKGLLKAREKKRSADRTTVVLADGQVVPIANSSSSIASNNQPVGGSPTSPLGSTFDSTLGSTGTEDEAYAPMFVASGGRDKNIFIHDVSSGELVMRLREHDNWVNKVTFTSSGKHLISCADDGYVLIFALVTKSLFRKITAHAHFTTCLALHPENAPIMATGSADTTVKLWPCM